MFDIVSISTSLVQLGSCVPRLLNNMRVAAAALTRSQESLSHYSVPPTFGMFSLANHHPLHWSRINKNSVQGSTLFVLLGLILQQKCKDGQVSAHGTYATRPSSREITSPWTTLTDAPPIQLSNTALTVRSCRSTSNSAIRTKKINKNKKKQQDASWTCSRFKGRRRHLHRLLHWELVWSVAPLAYRREGRKRIGDYLFYCNIGAI